MSAFRILVADDHPVFRFGVCSLLGSHEDWEICGQVADGRDAVEKCRQLKPDLLILDICMPKLNGVDAARQILRNDPAQKILVLTDVRSEQVVRDCLDAGVRGWVFKVDGTDDLIAAVETLQRNRSSFSSRVSDLIMDCYLKRQRVGPAGGQAARLSTSKEVAVILDVAVKTADTHRSNILRKLNLHSIAELVLYAVRNEIVHVQLPAVVRSPNPKLEAHTMPLSAIN